MKLEQGFKTIHHPMEQTLNIDSGTTLVEYTEVVADVPITMPDYDKKDDEIEAKLETIYTTALSNVTSITDEMETVEGKFKARIGEVAATMLNVALGAIREKSQLKQHKDKLQLDTRNSALPSRTETTNNNLIVADRNELLQILIDRQKNSK